MKGTLHLFASQPSCFNAQFGKLKASLSDGDAVVLMADAAASLLQRQAKNKWAALNVEFDNVDIFLLAQDAEPFVQTLSVKSTTWFTMVDDQAWLTLCLEYSRSVTYL